jgi:hypothetical protein
LVAISALFAVCCRHASAYNAGCSGRYTLKEQQIQEESMIRIAIKALPAAVLCALGAITTPSALALEPTNLQAGPFFFTPTLDLEAYYTDNLWLTDSRKKDTWVGVLTPRLQTWLQDGVNTYSLILELEDSTYENSSDDDFTDYTAKLDVHHEFNARNVVNVLGEYYDGHEDRGTGLIEGDLSFFTDKPVEYTKATAGGDYTYGSKASKGRVMLAAKTVDYQYDNFRDFTRYRDYTQDTFGGTFFWKVAPRTDALVEVRYIDNDYDETDPSNPAGSFNSEEYNYLVGVVWEATAKTTGHVKVGIYDRQYDSGARSDDDGPTWEVGVEWKPRTYSVLDLQTRRFTQETNGLGNAINTEEYALGWNHYWNQRAQTNLRVRYYTEDYQGSSREDDNYRAEARYDYEYRRWLDLGAGYRYEDRDSDINSFSYTANIFFLEARLSL